MNRLVLVAVVVVFALGCNPNYVSAPVSGVTLAAKDAAFTVQKDGSGKVVGAYVRLSDQPDVCNTAKANRALKSSTQLTLTFIKRNPDGATIAPDVGDYTAVDNIFALTKSSIASGVFERLDSSCNNTLGSNGNTESGTVTVSEFSIQTGGHMSGTFDITFGSQQDKVRGGFSATYCELASIPLNPNCE